MMRPSAGTRSPASSTTMSPGTSCSAGSSVTCPSRRTLDLTINIFCRAATLASALPSWFSPSTALKIVRATSSRAVPHCWIITPLTIPATSRTICIGSWYWCRKARQPGSFCSAVNAFGPYFFRRLSASARLSPVAASTSCSRRASSILSVCHTGPWSGGLLVDGIAAVISNLL